MKDKTWMWVAWKLPKRLVMWAAIRLIAHATQGVYGDTIVPELTAMDAIKRWDQKEDDHVAEIMLGAPPFNIIES